MNQKKHEAADRKRLDHEKANEKLKEHTSNHINNIVEVKTHEFDRGITFRNSALITMHCSEYLYKNWYITHHSDIVGLLSVFRTQTALD